MCMYVVVVVVVVVWGGVTVTRPRTSSMMPAGCIEGGGYIIFIDNIEPFFRWSYI